MCSGWTESRAEKHDEETSRRSVASSPTSPIPCSPLLPFLGRLSYDVQGKDSIRSAKLISGGNTQGERGSTNSPLEVAHVDNNKGNGLCFCCSCVWGETIKINIDPIVQSPDVLYAAQIESIRPSVRQDNVCQTYPPDTNEQQHAETVLLHNGGDNCERMGDATARPATNPVGRQCQRRMRKLIQWDQQLE